MFMFFYHKLCLNCAIIAHWGPLCVACRVLLYSYSYFWIIICIYIAQRAHGSPLYVTCGCFFCTFKNVSILLNVMEVLYMSAWSFASIFFSMNKPTWSHAYICVCLFVCARTQGACVRACVRAVCIYVRACVRALYVGTFVRACIRCL